MDAGYGTPVGFPTRLWLQWAWRHPSLAGHLGFLGFPQFGAQWLSTLSVAFRLCGDGSRGCLAWGGSPGSPLGWENMGSAQNVGVPTQKWLGQGVTGAGEGS